MARMHYLLHEMSETLTNFIKKEKEVGSEKALDGFAEYIAYMAEQVNQVHLEARVIKHRDAYGITVVLRRGEEKSYSWAFWRAANLILKTNNPSSHGLQANPDANGDTWYLNHNDQKIPLEPKEGHMIYFRLYEDYEGEW